MSQDRAPGQTSAPVAAVGGRPRKLAEGKVEAMRAERALCLA